MLMRFVFNTQFSDICRNASFKIQLYKFLLFLQIVIIKFFTEILTDIVSLFQENITRFFVNIGIYKKK